MKKISRADPRPFFSPPAEKTTSTVSKVAFGVICGYVSYGLFAGSIVAFALQATYSGAILLVSTLVLKLIQYYYSYSENEIKTLTRQCTKFNDKQSIGLLLNTDPAIRQMLSELTIECLKEENEKDAVNLIKMGANVNQIVIDGKDKTTILYKAILLDRLEVMEYLLENGYAIKEFPLVLVCSTKTLNFLIKHGANLQEANFLQICFEDIVKAEKPEDMIWSAKTVASLIEGKSFSLITTTFCNMNHLHPFLAENDPAIKRKLSELKENGDISSIEYHTLLGFLNNPGVVKKNNSSASST